MVPTQSRMTQTGGHGAPRPVMESLCGYGSHLGEIVDGVATPSVVRDPFRRSACAVEITTSGGVVSLPDPIRIPQ